MEEYSLIFKYIKGPDNGAGDTLSSLPLMNSDATYIKNTREKSAVSYCVNKLEGDMFPVKFGMIEKNSTEIQRTGS